MSKEAAAVAGMVSALIGLVITLSGHWIVGNMLSVAGVVLSITFLAKAK
jgi:hypothetical protein